MREIIEDERRKESSTFFSSSVFPLFFSRIFRLDMHIDVKQVHRVTGWFSASKLVVHSISSCDVYVASSDSVNSIFLPFILFTFPFLSLDPFSLGGSFSMRV